MCVEESQRSGSLKIKPATEANDRLVETVGGGSVHGDKPAWRLTVETRRLITLKAEYGHPAAWLVEVAKRAADPEVGLRRAGNMVGGGDPVGRMWRKWPVIEADRRGSSCRGEEGGLESGLLSSQPLWRRSKADQGGGETNHCCAESVTLSPSIVNST